MPAAPANPDDTDCCPAPRKRWSESRKDSPTNSSCFRFHVTHMIRIRGSHFAGAGFFLAPPTFLVFLRLIIRQQHGRAYILVGKLEALPPVGYFAICVARFGTQRVKIV